MLEQLTEIGSAKGGLLLNMKRKPICAMQDDVQRLASQLDLSQNGHSFFQYVRVPFSHLSQFCVLKVEDQASCVSKCRHKSP